MSDKIKCRERPYDFHSFVAPAPRQHPAVSRPLLGYALYFCRHARSSLLCIGVFSIVDDGEGRY